MKNYTQAELDALLACPKVVIDPPKNQLRLENGNHRNDMRLRSDELNTEFKVFMRINERFPENFSIGLICIPKDDESFAVVRFNGPHGDFEFVEENGKHVSHSCNHIHLSKPENIKNGFRPERGGEPTDKYASFQQALVYFLKLVNIPNPQDYFPEIVQPSFQFKSES